MSTPTNRPQLTNVLSKAKSPYLLQHQDNPVAVKRCMLLNW
jgi:uncharacterized protein YyaL (SSP411 family)